MGLAYWAPHSVGMTWGEDLHIYYIHVSLRDDGRVDIFFPDTVRILPHAPVAQARQGMSR